jgi:hypothetical protein
MRIPRIVPVALALAAALALSSCGGDDDDSSDSTSATTTAAADDIATETTDSTDADAAESSDGGDDGALPDPCSLIPSDELSTLVGSDVGIGTTQDVVEQRRVCTYESGLILAVEVAEDWEMSLDLLRDSTGADSVEEIPDVGNAAVWQTAGGDVGQFLALDDDVFVGVTLVSGGPAVGQAVAEAMLAAL